MYSNRTTEETGVLLLHCEQSCEAVRGEGEGRVGGALAPDYAMATGGKGAGRCRAVAGPEARALAGAASAFHACFPSRTLQ